MVKLKVCAATVTLDTDLPDDMDVGTVGMLLGAETGVMDPVLSCQGVAFEDKAATLKACTAVLADLKRCMPGQRKTHRTTPCGGCVHQQPGSQSQRRRPRPRRQAGGHAGGGRVSHCCRVRGEGQPCVAFRNCTRRQRAALLTGCKTTPLLPPPTPSRALPGVWNRGQCGAQRHCARRAYPGTKGAPPHTPSSCAPPSRTLRFPVLHCRHVPLDPPPSPFPLPRPSRPAPPRGCSC